MRKPDFSGTPDSALLDMVDQLREAQRDARQMANLQAEIAQTHMRTSFAVQAELLARAKADQSVE